MIVNQINTNYLIYPSSSSLKPSVMPSANTNSISRTSTTKEKLAVDNHRDVTECKTNSVKRDTNQSRALITGINGQVGSYLAELLIGKGYVVHGMIRRESSLNSNRLTHLFQDKLNRQSKCLKLHYGDLNDSNSLLKLIIDIQPHEVYNLAAQSHVKISFDMAELTGNTNALGTLRMLEAIRSCEMLSNQSHRIKFYQASTSELFGGSINHSPQSEKTPFYPRSPYGCSKLYAHSLVVNFRESYNMFAVNGILFNHESPRRGENFVTRKISRSVAEIKLGRRDYFELGNLDARRDWGHARDYVVAIWRMLQQPVPKDYVVATGKAHSVRDFVEEAFLVIDERITWSGQGLDEVGIGKEGLVRILVSEKYYRPAEVDHLLGDSSLARKELGWKPKITFKELVKEMVQSDIELLRKSPDS